MPRDCHSNFDLVISNYHTFLTAVMYPKDLDIPIPDINVLNERINSPEYQVQARIIIAWNLLILAMRINQKY
ncbi:hypothetical protein PRLR5107_30720 [Prevotella lacticifex]|uniref:Uncharacterized protein n=1 Tax=Prevotella lacticifex TaxID=2854755 RepID=A0A9R1C861_9BACT|nr:hypothetical protein PRLR5003_29590 [Prevotella lacticifex]GJG40856.1 hypothetical protein PRLR5019_28270 [Prevotella lacticifex]GJG43676.1 hypothetical protein PRLR5025_24620 [Prevotella lacticifex]GJG47457.1 hypothetical protein PRLR5027_30520 [Prevotella lacticifex]GJG49891.1 hypothetical protein PRLR5052_23040 [Prevotella lacticifex]